MPSSFLHVIHYSAAYNLNGMEEYASSYLPLSMSNHDSVFLCHWDTSQCLVKTNSTGRRIKNGQAQTTASVVAEALQAEKGKHVAQVGRIGWIFSAVESWQVTIAVWIPQKKSAEKKNTFLCHKFEFCIQCTPLKLHQKRDKVMELQSLQSLLQPRTTLL